MADNQLLTLLSRAGLSGPDAAALLTRWETDGPSSGSAQPAVRQLYGPFPFDFETPDLYQPAAGAELFTLPAGAIIETAWVEQVEGGLWENNDATQGFDILAGDNWIVQYDFAANQQVGIAAGSLMEVATPVDRRSYHRALSDESIKVSAWGDESTPAAGAGNLYALITIPA